MSNLRFDAARFVARLPRAYYADTLDMAPAPGVWNIEVDSLAVSGTCRLRLRFAEGVGAAKVCLDRRVFEPVAISDRATVVPVTVDHQLLSFDVEVQPAILQRCPLECVELIDPSCPDRAPVEFARYTRDTRMEQCNLLDDWAASRRRIESEDFDLHELVRMRDALIDWSARRQVLDRNDSHYGAVYSEEDKYSFTDAIFAACAFMRRFKRTGDHGWHDRAVAARDYAFKGQYHDTGDPGRDGAWASMGIIDDPRGKRFRRIADPWAQASGVDTCIIAVASGQLHAMGMPFADGQLDQLRHVGTWQKANRIAPDWFSHHEGADTQCLNMNALAAAGLYAVHRVLHDRTGAGLDEPLLREADRAYEHVLGAQEAIGVYPYLLGDWRRGGAYHLHNLPDNGIGLYHQMHLVRDPLSPFSLAGLRDPMRRSALWYLLTSRWDGDHLVLEYDAGDEYCRGLAFGNFTWCRVTMADVISQLWNTIGDATFWRQFVRAHLRTVREHYWNHDDPEHAPIRASVVPVGLVSWIQQAEWAALVFDNLATRFGLIESVDPTV